MYSLFSKFWRNALFTVSLLIFAASLVFTSLLIFDRELPQKREISKPQALEIDVYPISLSKNKISLKTWGNTRACQIVNIHAPLSQKIVQSADLYEGKFVKEGESLFVLESKKIQLAIRQLKHQVEGLKLKSKELDEQLQLSKRRQENIIEIIAVNKAALERQERSLLLEKQLFKKAQTLYEQENISNSEYLRQLSKIENLEASYLGSKARLGEIEDSEISLLIEQSRLQQAHDVARKEIEQSFVELENLQDDLQRSEIKAPISGKIIKVLVEKGQEIKSGQEMASIRAVDETELRVFIPDSYFKWLYKGPLLKMNAQERAEQNFLLELVNRDFKKQFSGAYIKSIDQATLEKSRSLPLLLARKNPLLNDGRPLAEEELLPGMYCQVQIDLCELEQTFLLPKNCLQAGSRIYHLVLSEDLQTTELGIIENFEILYSDEKGMIAKLPEKYRHLLLINEPLKGIEAGDPLKIQNLKKS